MSGSDELAQLRVSLIRRARVTRGGETRSTLVLDVGLRGVFVEWPEPPPPLGERVRISFRLPDSEQPIETDCRVAWHRDAKARGGQLVPGIGLEFGELAEADRTRLRTLLEEHLRREPRARQFTRWWPDPDEQ